jgi:hypothetical protein
VRSRYRHRFGGILWEMSADIDDAICLAKGFDNPDDAIQLLGSNCEDGQRWAVVDLASMRVVASGSRPYAAAGL